MRRYPHVLLGSLCGGMASANLVRAVRPLGVMLPLLLAVLLLTQLPAARLLLLALALAVSGWWWASARLDVLDRSVLAAYVGRAERVRLVVTAPPRRSAFSLRVAAQVRRFGALSLREPVLLELPPGRAPPQGALIELVGVVQAPRPRSAGFDEARWLRRRGVHVVVHGERWRVVGRRRGLGSVADRVHGALARSLAPGLGGERRAVIEGVVLGEDGGLSAELKTRFRASGLYHLLAVSGQNVALVAAALLGLAWLLGIPRWLGEVAALGGIVAYVLAVGAQPSVVRAGVAAALGSLAWLTARERDRWYALLLGALALLTWNPYSLLDAGFQLSFTAVVSIFTLVRPIERFLEGYPLPRPLAQTVAVAAACGAGTAPIAWLQFHSLPLLTVPANALAAPAVVPLLGLGFASAALAPFAPSAAALLAQLNGLCAAYLASCARVVGGLPGAQVTSGRVALALLLLAVATGAYAWPRCRAPSKPST